MHLRKIKLQKKASLLKAKRSQAELITTVLLILISIAAVVLVSNFVINMVRNYLKGTECFQTTGQLSINTDGESTYFSDSKDQLQISIERETKEFNLTGILVIYGTESSTVKKEIIGTNVTGVAMGLISGTLNSTIVYPDRGEMKTYVINVPANSAVSKVSIAPIIGSGLACDKVDEKTIPTRP